MTKHTPGPWSVTKFGYVTAPEPNFPKSRARVQVAIVGDFAYDDLVPQSGERWKADGKLIAAAPDLLALARKIALFSNDPLLAREAAAYYESITGEVPQLVTEPAHG